MLVHIEWLFWALLSLSYVSPRLCVYDMFSTILLFLFSVLWPCWHPPPQPAKLKSNPWWSLIDKYPRRLDAFGNKGLGIDTSNHVLADDFHWDGWFLSWICVLRLCFHITSLMLFRLYSIREDYLNVSNVDLYYSNNSQVYVGLFLFFKNFTFDTVKNLSFRKIKNNTVLTKRSVVFVF